MKIDKVFLGKSETALDKIEFEKRSSIIRNPDGSVVFEMNDVFVPKHWSQISTDIIAQKYFRKAGVPKYLKKVKEKGVPEWLSRSVIDEEKCVSLKDDEKSTHENDSRQVFHRLAGCWTYWGWKHN